MIQQVFVDTGAWYAAMVRKDRDHDAAKQFLQNNTSPLMTSDYVMDETVTLLLSRVGHRYAVKFLDMLQASREVQLTYLTPAQIAATADLFRKRTDKEWSFTPRHRAGHRARGRQQSVQYRHVDGLTHESQRAWCLTHVTVSPRNFDAIPLKLKSAVINAASIWCYRYRIYHPDILVSLMLCSYEPMKYSISRCHIKRL